MKLICFDCDSTLSQIEGVDELAAVHGDRVKQQIIDLTNQAMSGEIAIEEIFAKRLDLIQPTEDYCAKVGQLYIDKVAAGAKELVAKLQSEGWKVVIISGGFIQPIQPFAKYLGIDEIHAVPLHFNDDGSYQGFTASPTTRNGGKPEIVRELLDTYKPEFSVMVGDGVSDLECQGLVDLFIGYGEFEKREAVSAKAESYVYRFAEMAKILKIEI